MFIRSLGGWRFVGPLREADTDQGGETSTLAERAATIRAKAGEDATAAANQLALMVAERERENAGYRQGTLVLDAATAAIFQAHQVLGTPDEVQQLLAERATFATENAGFKREKEIAQVAQIAGFKPDVLIEYGGAAAYVIEQVDEGGKQVEKGFVMGGDQKTPIDQHFAKLLPALKATPERPGAGIGSPTRPIVTQSSTTTTATTPRKPMTRL